MRTELVAFGPEHLDAVGRFSAEVWERPRSRAFLHWRYLEHPDHRAYLAMRDQRCIAMVSVFRRPYRVGSAEITVNDAFDWFCLPELVRSGAGVRAMQRLLRDPEPVIVTGGTDDTRDLLPRMGFETPETVRRYGLLLDGKRAADALARRTPVPRALARAGFALIDPLLRPRVRSRVAGARVEAPKRLDEKLLSIDPRLDGRGSLPVWTPAYLDWLAAGSRAVGRFEPLAFYAGDAPIGWALMRIFEGPTGREASLIDVRAQLPSEAHYAWMISEVAVRAARAGAGLLAAGATCPYVEAGLRANRFRLLRSTPIHYRHPEGAPLEAPILFGTHWGDELLLPYATGGWPEA